MENHPTGETCPSCMQDTCKIPPYHQFLVDFTSRIKIPIDFYPPAYCESTQTNAYDARLEDTYHTFGSYPITEITVLSLPSGDSPPGAGWKKKKTKNVNQYLASFQKRTQHRDSEGLPEVSSLSRLRTC